MEKVRCRGPRGHEQRVVAYWGPIKVVRLGYASAVVGQLDVKSGLLIRNVIRSKHGSGHGACPGMGSRQGGIAQCRVVAQPHLWFGHIEVQLKPAALA